MGLRARIDISSVIVGVLLAIGMANQLLSSIG